MNSRGVLYITFPGYLSEESSEALLERSIASLKRWHPDMPYHVARLPEGATLLDKAKMFDLSPFDDTLFLDIDTVVMGDLSFGFTLMERYGLAAAICEAPYARRFKGLADAGDLIEYNTGVLWFDKTSNIIADFFRRWKYHAAVMPSSVKYIGPNGPAEMAAERSGVFRSRSMGRQAEPGDSSDAVEFPGDVAENAIRLRERFGTITMIRRSAWKRGTRSSRRRELSSVVRIWTSNSTSRAGKELMFVWHVLNSFAKSFCFTRTDIFPD